MTTHLPAELMRAGYKSESTFRSAASLGSLVGVLIESASHELTRDGVPLAVTRNSQRDDYADRPGFKRSTAQMTGYVSSDFGTQFGPLVECSLGAEVAAATLAALSSGNQSTVTVASSSTFDHTIKVVGDDGETYFVPVKSATGTVATFAALLPTGVGADGGKPKNASETGGIAWQDDPAGAVTSFRLFTDNSGDALEQRVEIAGAVPGPISLVYEPNALLKISVPFSGCEWDLSGSSTLSDVAPPAQSYHAAVATCALQDLGTPVALARLVLKSLSLTIGYTMLQTTGSTGTSGGDVPASDVTGVTRQWSAGELIELVIDDPDWAAYDAHRAAETPLLFWLEFRPGNPGNAAGSTALTYWAPRVKVVAASRTEVDGVACTALSLKRERQLSPVHRREYLSFFGAS